jgi:hypothetical protein
LFGFSLLFLSSFFKVSIHEKSSSSIFKVVYSYSGDTYAINQNVNQKL